MFRSINTLGKDVRWGSEWSATVLSSGDALHNLMLFLINVYTMILQKNVCVICLLMATEKRTFYCNEFLICWNTLCWGEQPTGDRSTLLRSVRDSDLMPSKRVNQYSMERAYLSHNIMISICIDIITFQCCYHNVDNQWLLLRTSTFGDSTEYTIAFEDVLIWW